MQNLFLTALLAGFLISSCDAQNSEISIPVNEFESEINRGNVQVLDVRTAEEFKSGHLKNSFQADWYNTTQFNERIQHLDKSRPVYVYCLSGARSGEAVTRLQQNGFKNVVHLKGGLNAWKRAGKPVESEKNVQQITLEEYNTKILSEVPVLVDFGADWCPPCKTMDPIIAKISDESAGKFSLVKIDASTQTEILKQMNIDALPVFIIYKNGKEVWRKDGVASLEELKSQLFN